MLALSIVFLAVLVIPVLDESLPTGWLDAFAVTDSIIWGLFAAEYLIRLVIVVPVLRTLRLVRLVRLVRFARSGAVAAHATQHSRSHLHVSVAIQIAATAVIVMFVGAVGVLDVERHAAGANIRTFGDGVWWALTTLTTVGYGDRYPVTTEGRLIAAAVMLTGIAVVGVVTASIAAWFVDKLRTIQQAEVAQIERDRDVDATLAEILEKLTVLEARLSTETRAADSPRGKQPNPSAEQVHG